MTIAGYLLGVFIWLLIGYYVIDIMNKGG